MATRLSSIITWACMLGVVKFAAGELTLRLAGGTSPLEGRLEVYYDGQWGTVCDDNWQDSYCGLVCKQLGFTGGKLVAANPYGTCNGQIWLDDVTCHGHEISLDQCDRGFWGNYNCGHEEDVACECTSNTPVDGTCDPSKHRLRPWNEATPWIGRVEVQNELGIWGTVCDDTWGDSEAHVICSCLGYSETDSFRAYWSRNLVGMEPLLPMSYDNITCDSAACAVTHNLWECDTHASTGRCDAATETAAVACGEVPQPKIPSPPTLEVECSSNILTVCFKSEDYEMDCQFLELLPNCAAANAYNVTGGVCYDVNMSECDAGEMQSDMASKHYCYDVTYSQFDSSPGTLITDEIWTRRACCSVAKNGTISSNFASANIIQPALKTETAVYAEESTEFTLTCYTDKSFTGTPLAFPANVTRGQDLYCRVTAHAWDDSLFLIVPSCEFRAFEIGGPSFEFLYDKCPTTGELQMNYFGFDTHNWGLQFQVPKFQGYETLFMECTAYVCDSNMDAKPYCDRSCTSSDTSKRRRRDTSRGTRFNNPDQVKWNHVSKGPFVIRDNGVGPLITNSETQLINTNFNRAVNNGGAGGSFSRQVQRPDEMPHLPHRRQFSIHVPRDDHESGVGSFDTTSAGVAVESMTCFLAVSLITWLIVAVVLC